jgi:hypothetical protein
VFREMELRFVFAPMRVEVIKHWRKLRADELHNLYSPNIIPLVLFDEVSPVPRI